MGKKCRVYKKLPTAGYGGDRVQTQQEPNPLVEELTGKGMVTQDSSFQPVGKKKTAEFVEKLDMYKQDFAEDEEVADQIAIMESISKEIPEFKNGGWMQSARKSMKRKGTVGKFTEFCGGKVTSDCIERGLNSPDEKVQARAKFAKAARTIAQQKAQWGGSIMDGSAGQMAQIPMAQGGYSYGDYAGGYNGGYANMGPGVWMKGQMNMEDPNAAAWRQHQEYLDKKNKYRLNDVIQTSAGLSNAFLNTPDVYKFKGDQAIFDDPNINVDELSITGYQPGRGGKTATLNYSAKGTGPQRSIGGNPNDYTGGIPQIGEPTGAAIEQLPEGYGPGTAFRPTSNTPGTTHGDMNRSQEIGNMANPWNKFLPAFQGNVGGSQVTTDYPDLGVNSNIPWNMDYMNQPYTFGQENEMFSAPPLNQPAYDNSQVNSPLGPEVDMNQLDSPYGNGYNPWDVSSQDRPDTNIPLMSENFGAPNAEYDIQMDQNAEAFNPTTQYETEGDLILDKQSKLKTLMETSPYAIPTALTQLPKALEMFAPGRAEEEAAIAERISDPFRRFNTSGTNRGERGVNAWRIGAHLAPTEHTRKGFDTKTAQAGTEVGYEEGQELDLSPEELQELMAMGYEFDIIQ